MKPFRSKNVERWSTMIVGGLYSESSPHELCIVFWHTALPLCYVRYDITIEELVHIFLFL